MKPVMPIITDSCSPDIYSNHIPSVLPTISIITICRNAEATLKTTMVSVLTQTYAPIEYIIMDGLSSDHTVDIARQVASLFPERKIKIISEADTGISDAMNKSVRMANGEVVAMLHAGDYYVGPTVIERVMASFERDHWRWAIAKIIVVNVHGQHLHVSRLRPDYRHLLKQNFISHPSTFIVRDIFAKHGFFRVDLKQAMDYEFWLRIAFKGGERYKELPFVTTFFLDGGRSSRLGELLHYLIILRREMRSWAPGLNLIADMLFLARVMAFSGYFALKRFVSKMSWASVE